MESSSRSCRRKEPPTSCRGELPKRNSAPSLAPRWSCDIKVRLFVTAFHRQKKHSETDRCIGALYGKRLNRRAFTLRELASQPHTSKMLSRQPLNGSMRTKASPTHGSVDREVQPTRTFCQKLASTGTSAKAPWASTTRLWSRTGNNNRLVGSSQVLKFIRGPRSGCRLPSHNL